LGRPKKVQTVNLKKDSDSEGDSEEEEEEGGGDSAAPKGSGKIKRRDWLTDPFLRRDIMKALEENEDKWLPTVNRLRSLRMRWQCHHHGSAAQE